MQVELVQTLPYVIVIIVLTGLGLSEKRGEREGPYDVFDGTESSTEDGAGPRRRPQFFFLAGMPNFIRPPPRRWSRCARPPPGAERRPNCCPRSRAALSGIRRLRMAQTAAPSFYRRQRQRLTSKDSSQRAHAKLLRKAPLSVFATDLALFLREQSVERVGIAGVKTNVCMRATVQDPSPMASTPSFQGRLPIPTDGTWRKLPLRTYSATLVKSCYFDRAQEMLGDTIVAGYASLDYTVTLDRAPEPDRTATVSRGRASSLASADRRRTCSSHGRCGSRGATL